MKGRYYGKVIKIGESTGDKMQENFYNCDTKTAYTNILKQERKRSQTKKADTTKNK